MAGPDRVEVKGLVSFSGQESDGEALEWLEGRKK